MNRHPAISLTDPRPWLAGVAGLGFLAVALLGLFSAAPSPWTPLLVLAPFGAIAVFRWPWMGVLAVFALLSLEISAGLFGSRFLRLPYLLGAILTVPLGLTIFREGTVRVLRVPQIRLLLAIGALVLLSSAWNEIGGRFAPIPELDKTEWRLVAFLSRFAFLVLFVYFVDTPARIRAAVWTILAVTAIGALDSWGNVFGVSHVERAAGSFGHAANANRLAFICLFGTALAWYWQARERMVTGRPALLAAVLLFPATALATGSRAGFLEAAALTAFILKDGWGRSLGKRLQGALLVAAVGLVLFSVVPTELMNRATNFNPWEDAGQESLRNRMFQVGNAWGLFLQHPILGIGIGNFETMATPAEGWGFGTHNAFLRALTENGPAVLVLYLVLFGVTWRSLRQYAREGPEELVWLSKALQAGLVLFMIRSISADAWIDDHLYMLLGLAIALDLLRQRALATRTPDEVIPGGNA